MEAYLQRWKQYPLVQMQDRATMIEKVFFLPREQKCENQGH